MPRVTTKRTVVQSAFKKLEAAAKREREELTISEALAQGKDTILKKIRGDWSIDEVVDFLINEGVQGSKATMTKEIRKLAKDGAK